MTRTLVRTGLPKDSDKERRAVVVSFLDVGHVLVITNQGEHKVLSQAGMIDAWEELWHDVARGLETGGWERA